MSKTNAICASGCGRIRPRLWRCSARCRPTRSNCSSWSAKITWKELKGTRSRWRKIRRRENNLDCSFSSCPQHQGQRRSAARTGQWRRPGGLLILCNCCMRVAHGLESLLDPFRGVSAGPLSERDDPNRPGNVRRDPALVAEPDDITSAKDSPSPELLERLGIRTDPAPMRPACGWARSRVSQHHVAMRRDDRGLPPAHGGGRRAHWTRPCNLSARSHDAVGGRAIPEKRGTGRTIGATDCESSMLRLKPGAALGSEERSALGRAFQILVPFWNAWRLRAGSGNIRRHTAAPLSDRSSAAQPRTQRPHLRRFESIATSWIA